MQVAKPFILYLPSGFLDELERQLDVNPPDWKYRMEVFQYLAHYLTVKQIQQKEKDYCSINTKKLKGEIIWNIDSYVRYLVKGELFQRDNFEIGRKAYHYRINPKFRSGSSIIEIKPGTKLYGYLIKKTRLNRTHINRQALHLQAMWKHLKEVELDIPEARKWVDMHSDGTKKYVYHTSLSMLEDKRRRYFKRNRTNDRVDTNLTNLKKELRFFLKGDYVSIDLANSQPFLLYQLLDKIQTKIQNNSIINNTTIHSIPLCNSIFDYDVAQWFGKQQINSLLKLRQNGVIVPNGEFLKFRNSVLAGTFYEDFQNSFQQSLERDKVKEILFAVLFSQNVIHEDFKPVIPYQKEKAIFASVYPNIYEMIKTLKHRDHTRLSILLQRMEAKIFIDTICRELVDMGIVPLTIHDSIIVEAGQAIKAFKVCEKIFKQEFGVVPTFHVEQVKKPGIHELPKRESEFDTLFPKKYRMPVPRIIREHWLASDT